MDFRIGIPSSLIRNFALIILLGSCSAVQAAAMYKWVDDEGNIHYDQSPPADRESERLEGPETPSPEATPESAKEVTDQSPPAVTEDENTRIKRQNCEAARRNQELYKRSDKILQPDGSELVLSDEMRAERLRQVAEDIKKFCE
jgi:hypothetical protein